MPSARHMWTNAILLFVICECRSLIFRTGAYFSYVLKYAGIKKPQPADDTAGFRNSEYLYPYSKQHSLVEVDTDNSPAVVVALPRPFFEQGPKHRNLSTSAVHAKAPFTCYWSGQSELSSSSQRMSGQRSRRGCEECRRRRRKCNEQKPTCGHCATSNRTCKYSLQLVWGGRKFEKSRFGQCLQLAQDSAETIGTDLFNKNLYC